MNLWTSSLYAYSTSLGIAAVDMEETPPSLKRLKLVKEEEKEEEEVEEEREESTQLKLLIGRKRSRSTGETAISLSYSSTPFSALTSPIFFSPENDSRDRRLQGGETDAKNRNKAKVLREIWGGGG